MSGIDFQARIEYHARGAVKETAFLAIHLLNECHVWQYDVTLQDGKVHIVVWNPIIPFIGDHEAPYMVFNFAGRTIDAALLEQLHNEVTEWFTKVKSEATPCKDS